jgi:hypothetical protein
MDVCEIYDCHFVIRSWPLALDRMTCLIFVCSYLVSFPETVSDCRIEHELQHINLEHGIYVDNIHE